MTVNDLKAREQAAERSRRRAEAITEADLAAKRARSELMFVLKRLEQAEGHSEAQHSFRFACTAIDEGLEQIIQGERRRVERIRVDEEWGS